MCHVEVFEQIKMDKWMDGWMEPGATLEIFVGETKLKVGGLE